MKNSNKKKWQHPALHQILLSGGVVISTYETVIFRTAS
jgi:hypothetical protein